MSTLLGAASSINVSIKQPGRVTLALRTAELDRAPRPRGSPDRRPKSVTLATAKRTYKRAGRYKVVLKPRGQRPQPPEGARDADRALHRAGARARSGFVQVANRRVRVAGSARRR